MDAEGMEIEALEHLENIEEDLDEIKRRTPTRWRSFVYGVLHGAGALIGSVLALALLGWLLTLIGVLPGLDKLAPYIQKMVDRG